MHIIAAYNFTIKTSKLQHVLIVLELSLGRKHQ